MEENSRYFYDIVFNYLLDLKKKEIDPIERARILKDYCTVKGISQRELAKRLGLPHSTVQDWCQYSLISETEYNEMKSKGLNETEIYQTIRENRTNKEPDWKLQTDLDYALKEISKILTKHSTNRSPNSTTNTLNLIAEIKDKLNRVAMHVERGR